jgi:hypothetical protein
MHFDAFRQQQHALQSRHANQLEPKRSSSETHGKAREREERREASSREELQLGGA